MTDFWVKIVNWKLNLGRLNVKKNGLYSKQEKEKDCWNSE